MMSKQRRYIYWSLVGTTLLSLLVGVFLFARKRFSKSTPPTKVIKHAVETSSEDALAYWTADKMRDAQPAPLPIVNEHNREKRPPNASRSQQN
ncbi:MAG: hypothetical protein PVS3B3_02110 [Ktedonobacteraceae bacterium]